MADLAFLAQHTATINEAIEAMLARREHAVAPRLLDAMRYSLTAGGKRVRPVLMIESYLACGGNPDALAARLLPAALSIEALHTYSLIHDDLPCMDNDDLRRGMPTCHRQFDEATAILAGDALQSLAFELLLECAVAPEVKLELLHRFAIAAGGPGMVGGQMLDMQAEQRRVDNILEVERIHLHKTGALLCYSCEAGALLADGTPEAVEACSRYGKAVGLLFQIADDILDATASSEELGKSAGKDAAQRKATYVSLLGLPRARELGGEMLEMALDSLKPLGERGVDLTQLATYILERRS